MTSLSINSLFTIDSRVYGLTLKSDVDKVSKAIAKSAQQITFDVLHAEAEKLARMVREEIDAQPATWQPLNPTYLKWKERVGLNTDMLKATENYYNSIAVQEVRNHLGRYTAAVGAKNVPRFTIRVGVPLTKHPGLGDADDKDTPKIRYTDLAAILEFGNEHMPARPHWGPAYRRWRAQHARSVKARIMSLLMRKFRSDFKAHITKPSKARKLR